MQLLIFPLLLCVLVGFFSSYFSVYNLKCIWTLLYFCRCCSSRLRYCQHYFLHCCVSFPYLILICFTWGSIGNNFHAFTPPSLESTRGPYLYFMKAERLFSNRMYMVVPLFYEDREVVSKRSISSMRWKVKIPDANFGHFH